MPMEKTWIQRNYSEIWMKAHLPICPSLLGWSWQYPSQKNPKFMCRKIIFSLDKFLLRAMFKERWWKLWYEESCGLAQPITEPTWHHLCAVPAGKLWKLPLSKKGVRRDKKLQTRALISVEAACFSKQVLHCVDRKEHLVRVLVRSMCGKELG